jgi:hypothetical protein
MEERKLCWFALWFAGAIAPFLLSCGGSDSSPCASLGELICDKACLCDPLSDHCCYGSSTGSVGCVRREACMLNFTNNICGDSTKTESLFSACRGSVEQAQCVDGGPDNKYAKLPAACDELLICRSGPCKN